MGILYAGGVGEPEVVEASWKGWETRSQSNLAGAITGVESDTIHHPEVQQFSVSSPHNSPSRLIARNNTEPTPVRHALARAESTPCRFDRRRTFGEPFTTGSATNPPWCVRACSWSLLNLLTRYLGLDDICCTGGSRDPIGKTTSLLIASAPGLTFSCLQIRTGREALESISFYRAEVTFIDGPTRLNGCKLQVREWGAGGMSSGIL